jgi:hypothetical protein
MSKRINKGDGPMNKDRLFKNLLNISKGNFFSIEIPTVTKEDKKIIVGLIEELKGEGKIKLREYVQLEYSVYLHGIIKYASE